jgi:nucleotide-binding universal stress UspA family protein
VCLDVLVPPVVLPDYYPGPGQTAPLVAARESEAGNLDRLRARLMREDVSWNVLETAGDPAVRLREAAPLADVAVVSCRNGGTLRDEALRTARKLAATSGLLILAVPPDCGGLAVSGRALVAWDGSQGANNALRAALPVLQLADCVTLVEIRRGGERFEAEDAATYLSRHRIRPAIVEETSAAPVADVLLDQVRATGCDYLVMGAFGHGRAYDALIGGTSSSVLRRSPVPVFMHH